MDKESDILGYNKRKEAKILTNNELGWWDNEFRSPRLETEQKTENIGKGWERPGSGMIEAEKYICKYINACIYRHICVYIFRCKLCIIIGYLVSLLHWDQYYIVLPPLIVYQTQGAFCIVFSSPCDTSSPSLKISGQPNHFLKDISLISGRCPNSG